MEEMVKTFLQFQTSLQIYHWRTKNYSRHKATDALYTSLQGKVDRFVETLLGSRQKSLSSNTKKLSFEIIPCDDTNAMRELLLPFQKYLEKLKVKKTETDLINLRDEMISDIHQALYLFTLH
jgi:hypothetical protein